MSQQQCRDRIEEAFVAAEKHYGRKFKRVKVTFSGRMTRCAGKAMYQRSDLTGKYAGTEIRLSSKLLDLNGMAFIEETPAHEAAHIISMEMYNEGGHGAAWKEVMKVVGLEHQRRCHNFKTPPKKSFSYKTDMGEIVKLTIIRHNKLQRGQVTWYSWSKKGKVYAKDFIKQCG